MQSRVLATHGPLTVRMLRLAPPFLVVLAGFVSTMSADAAWWYAGNKRNSAYGVQAYIWTPTSYPHIVAGGEYCWVSTSAPEWVQTGWAYWQGCTEVKRYVEVHIGGLYKKEWYGSQALNSSSHYKVQYNGSSTWYAYIDGGNKGGWGPIQAPRQVQALTEVHESSSNSLDTRFTTVQYRDNSGQDRDFDTANWSEDAPYKVDKYSYSNYRSWGP